MRAVVVDPVGRKANWSENVRVGGGFLNAGCLGRGSVRLWFFHDPGDDWRDGDWSNVGLLPLFRNGGG